MNMDTTDDEIRLMIANSLRALGTEMVRNKLLGLDKDSRTSDSDAATSKPIASDEFNRIIYKLGPVMKCIWCIDSPQRMRDLRNIMRPPMTTNEPGLLSGTILDFGLPVYEWMTHYATAKELEVIPAKIL